MLRYTLHISFKDYYCKDIVEPIKTLKEALSYSDLIDNTVVKAFIKDNVNGEVITLK